MKKEARNSEGLLVGDSKSSKDILNFGSSWEDGGRSVGGYRLYHVKSCSPLAVG